MDHTKLNLHQKINEIQKIITSVHKGSRVEVVKGKFYSAVSHDDIAALLHSPLAEIGIAIQVDMVDCQVTPIEKETTYNGQKDIKYSYQATVKMAVTFVNSDNPQDRFTVNSYGYAFDSGDKAIGKAESMAVKYVYLKNFNLESTDDEESRDYENQVYQGQRTSNTNTENRPTENQKEVPASSAQIGLLKRLGVSFGPGISKSEASRLIEQANKGK